MNKNTASIKYEGSFMGDVLPYRGSYYASIIQLLLINRIVSLLPFRGSITLMKLAHHIATINLLAPGAILLRYSGCFVILRYR